MSRRLPVYLRLGRLGRSVRLAWKNLALHRLRSLLTILGIIFGVCSVIAMLAIGEGASHEAQQQIRQLGSQNIILRSVKPPEQQKISDKGSQSFVLQYGLTYADLQRLQSSLPGVEIVVPGRLLRDYVWNINRRVECEILATIPDYLAMRNLTLTAGRFFTPQEMAADANVCVLGAETVAALFPLHSPLGRDVRVGAAYFRVVGVIEPRTRAPGPENHSGNGSADPAIHRMLIPLETAKTRYGEVLLRQRSGSFEAERVALHELTVKVASLEQVRSVAAAIQTMLERHHKQKDYELIVPLEMLRQAERTKYIFNVVLGSIAAISLLVGGIGIMNIMLASVTERTREIGIRRALGARRRDIIEQFLVETVLLSAAGGALGVATGLAIPFLVSQFAGMKTIVTAWSPLLAFTISALVGVVFGIYPALRAAEMDPVEALRHE